MCLTPAYRAAIGQRMNLGAARADEQRAVRAQRHRTRARHVVGIEGNFETGRQLDLVQRQVAGADGQAGGQEQDEGSGSLNHAVPLRTKT